MSIEETAAKIIIEWNEKIHKFGNNLAIGLSVWFVVYCLFRLYVYYDERKK